MDWMIDHWYWLVGGWIVAIVILIFFWKGLCANRPALPTDDKKTIERR